MPKDSKISYYYGYSIIINIDLFIFITFITQKHILHNSVQIIKQLSQQHVHLKQNYTEETEYFTAKKTIQFCVNQS